jgi:hypothetical protein
VINYGPLYHSTLGRFIPLQDSVAQSGEFTKEAEEAMYSFAPWWAGSEESMIVLAADLTFGSLFFYSSIDKYPRHYLDSFEDEDNFIVFKPDEFAFSRENTIFTRVRPDFHLYDLVSDRESIYDFYAFRQRTDLDYIPLQLNEPIMGYAEPGQNTYYRYFIVSATGNYSISLDAKSGSPELLVRVGGDDPLKPARRT